MNNSSFGLSRVYLFDTASPSFSNVLNSLRAFRDDSDRSGNCFGSDWMVTSDLSINKIILMKLPIWKMKQINTYHDDLDTGRAALVDRVRDCSSGRVNHRHQADKSESS